MSDAMCATSHGVRLGETVCALCGVDVAGRGTEPCPGLTEGADRG